MGTITSQITSLMIVYSTVYSSADESKHQSSASLAFVRGIHRRPVNFPDKGPVTRKMFTFDDVIMIMKFSGVITIDKSDVHAKGQGQRSKVKVTEVTILVFLDCNSSFNSQMATKWCTKLEVA